MMKRFKSITGVVSLVIATIVLVSVLCVLFLPVSVKETDIELQNIAVENIGKALYGEALTKKEWRSDYFYNKSFYGMDWNEYEKVCCEDSVFDAYSVSFEILNNTDKSMGLFSVDGLESDHIIVQDRLDNEESVYIDPGEKYLVNIIVYVDRDKFPNADEEFVLSKIEKINYSPLNGTGNAQIFLGGDVGGMFYKRYFIIEW